MSYRCFMALSQRRVATAKLFNKLEAVIFKWTLFFLIASKIWSLTCLETVWKQKIVSYRHKSASFYCKETECNRWKRLLVSITENLPFSYSFNIECWWCFRKRKQSKSYWHVNESTVAFQFIFHRLHFLNDTNF